MRSAARGSRSLPQVSAVRRLSLSCIQALEPTLPLPWDGDLRMRRLDQLEVIREMAIAHRIGLTGLGESFLAVLA